MSEAELPTTNTRKCFACIKGWPQNAAICIDAIEFFCCRFAKDLMRDSKLLFKMLFPTIKIPANIAAADSPIRRPDTKSCTSEPLAVADMALQARPRTMRMIPYRIFLPLQVLCAAQQVKDLLIVINPHAALRRILAVHQLGERNGKLPADLFNNAVIGHTLAVFPFGDRLIGHAEFSTSCSCVRFFSLRFLEM